MFGVVMCLLYIKTKNIWTNIAVHALNNLIATSMQFFGGEESGTISITELQAQSNLWIGIGLTVVGLLWLIPYVLETMAYSKRSWRATSTFYK